MLIAGYHNILHVEVVVTPRCGSASSRKPNRGGFSHCLSLLEILCERHQPQPQPSPHVNNGSDNNNGNNRGGNITGGNSWLTCHEINRAMKMIPRDEQLSQSNPIHPSVLKFLVSVATNKFSSAHRSRHHPVRLLDVVVVHL
jgi:hypothetical protein